ncbi:DNA-directed RNA polymerase subunit K [Thermoproteus tenax]|uniref:DNA-directed RNA polymerase subunit Rpo6 n=1 Tax=Thermoproteus tenax (strain ATCC 35583 / DSM 2078 / JCM 9277 / NBRC 100435 / Kra 1) TaxID=768679 RepID=G4RL88_THETK|nr:DNA-directed RNA polymerase subunit K [Thermoproteus tenax]CCC82333.1 DNA-directed RNA polymerase subunit K [Thermoproteus tenax Kra 1]
METRLSTPELVERIEKLVQALRSSLQDRTLYPPRLTRFEVARVIAARAIQLSMGAEPLIDISTLQIKDPVIIAIEEFKQGKLNFSIVRELPDGKTIKLQLKNLLEFEKLIQA